MRVRVRVRAQQIHCGDDPVTPLASAQRLQTLLPGRRLLVMIDGSRHTARIAELEPARCSFVTSLAWAGRVPAN